MRQGSVLTAAPAILLGLAAACADTTKITAPVMAAPVAGAADHSTPLVALTCSASVQQHTIGCTPDGGRIAAAGDVIFGGQNQFVTLTSSNVQILADTFAFDVTVKNLLPQAIGTPDGSSNSPTGVRVFFQSGPTSTSGGTISVANPNGVAAFTAPNQPYFQYDGRLLHDSVSAPKTWKLQFTPEVTSFTFTVYVSAEVAYPNGYIDDTPYVLALDPGETRALTGSVRNFAGTLVQNQTIAWSSDQTAVADVAGTQVTAGGSRGFATLTPTAGGLTAIYPTAVSVCQSTVVTNGTDLPSSIASSDCFSSFGSNGGKPTTSYYADLYRVTLTAGQTVTVTMDTGDALDSYLILAEGRLGTRVAANDDDDAAVLGVGSRLTYTATTSGVYIIEASTFNGLDTGNYTLHVTIN